MNKGKHCIAILTKHNNFKKKIHLHTLFKPISNIRFVPTNNKNENYRLDYAIIRDNNIIKHNASILVFQKDKEMDYYLGNDIQSGDTLFFACSPLKKKNNIEPKLLVYIY